MGTIKRQGSWTLHKVADGIFEIRENGEVRARLLTPEGQHVAGRGPTKRDVSVELYEVRDFSQVEREFRRFISDASRRGYSL